MSSALACALQGSLAPYYPIGASMPKRDGCHYVERLKHVFCGLNNFDPDTGNLTVPVRTHNVVAIRINEACLPRSGYVVSPCTFTVTPTGGPPVTVTVPGNKNYDVTSLATELQTAMQAADAALSAYTCAYATTTSKFTIAGASDFTVQFGATVSSRNLNYALGFGHATFAHASAGSALVSRGIADLQNGKYALFTCPQIKGVLGNTDIIGFMSIAGSVNYKTDESPHFRRFSQMQSYMGDVTVNIKTRVPSGECVQFDNRGVDLFVVFDVVFLHNQQSAERQVFTVQEVTEDV